MKNIIILMLLTLVSCSHSTHLVHMSDHSVLTSQSKGKKITALSEQFVVMSFVFDTNYVERAKTKLISKCRKGVIKNITTRYSTSHGFFSWTNKIFMQGVCFSRRS